MQTSRPAHWAFLANSPPDDPHEPLRPQQMHSDYDLRRQDQPAEAWGVGAALPPAPISTLVNVCPGTVVKVAFMPGSNEVTGRVYWEAFDAELRRLLRLTPLSERAAALLEKPENSERTAAWAKAKAKDDVKYKASEVADTVAAKALAELTVEVVEIKYMEFVSFTCLHAGLAGSHGPGPEGANPATRFFMSTQPIHGPGYATDPNSTYTVEFCMPGFCTKAMRAYSRGASPAILRRRLEPSYACSAAGAA